MSLRPLLTCGLSTTLLTACLGEPPDFPDAGPPPDALIDGGAVDVDITPAMLLSEQCPDIIGPLDVFDSTAEERAAAFLEAPDAHLLIGLMLPNGPFNVVRADAVVTSSALVLERVAAAIQGELPDEPAPRKIAALVCFEVGDDGGVDLGVRAARHAVDMGAVALVGGYSGRAATAILRDVSQPAEVPLVSPGAPSPRMPGVRAALGDRGLFWRVRVPSEPAMDLATRLLDGAGRIGLLYRPDDPDSRAMYDHLQPRLHGAQLVDIPLDSWQGPVVDLQLDPMPDVLVLLTGELQDQGALAAALAELPEPVDVLIIEGDHGPDMGHFMESFEEWPGGEWAPCRQLILRGGVRTALADLWEHELRLRQRADPPTHPAVFEYVDAVALTGLAVGAAGLLDGPSPHPHTVLDGLRLLSDPEGPKVGVAGFGSGLSALVERQGADYVGLSGAVDFDVRTRDVAERSVSVWRYVPSSDPALTPERVAAVDLDAPYADDLDGLFEPAPGCEAYPFAVLRAPNEP